MTWVAVPASIALLIKLYLIVVKKDFIKTNPAWYYFVFVFAINNLAELLILTSHNILSSELLARAYHPTAIAVLFYCMIYSMGGTKNKLDKFLIYAAGLCSIVLSAAIMLSDYVVLGGKPFGYYVTAIRGEHYYLFQTYVLSMCALISFILLRNFRSSKIESKVIESLWIIIALMPSVLITGVSVSLMVLGFKVNALVVTPIGATIFLIITMVSYSNGINRKDPRKFIPFTKEFVLSRTISKAENSFLNGDLTLPEATNEFEKALLAYVSQQEKGNISKIARRSGLGRSTLYQKGARLGYDWTSDRPKHK